MPNGYWDRILHVDLGTGTTRVESFGEAFWRRHLGGRSLIAHYLLTEVPIGTDPLSPDNVLIFAAGVLTGTPFPGSGRHSVGANKRTHGICTWRTTFAILRASHIRLRTSVGALASNAKALPQREYRDASRHVSLLTRSVCAYSLAA